MMIAPRISVFCIIFGALEIARGIQEGREDTEKADQGMTELLAFYSAFENT